MQLVPIPRENLSDAWQFIQPFAEQIAGRFPEEWPVPVILAAAGAEELLLWIIWDEHSRKPFGCVATRVITKASGKRVLDIAWTAGEQRNLWLPLLSTLEQWARDHGCEGVEFLGRWGWSPDLPDYRCQKMAVFKKDLTGGTDPSQRRE